MFGYVKPAAAELKVKEYELYRAVYCGLCAALGRNTTCVSRLSLSYDFVFLALVRMSLAGEVGRIEKRRCIAHPTKKRAVLVDAGQLDYCAKISAVLTYHKLLDDITDERGWKRLGAMLLRPAAAMMRRRAGLGAHPEDVIAGKLAEMASLEREGCASVDRMAEPFGEIMAAVCAYGFPEGSAEARIACEIGRHIGRFVYIADAMDDLPEDIRRGAYNPFIRMYGDDALTEIRGELALLERALTMELAGIEAAVELICFDAVPEYGNIIRNIIYLGLPERMRILSQKLAGSAADGEKNL